MTLKVGSGLVYSLPQGASVTLPISVSVTAAVGLASASVLVQYDPPSCGPPHAPAPEASGGFCNTAPTIRRTGSSGLNLLSQLPATGETASST